MGGAPDVLVPTKFILLTLQLLLTIIIYYTKQENIFAGLPIDAVYSDHNYDSANSSILGAITLSLICEIIEMLIMFTGITLFFNRLNSLQIVLHAIGTILYAWFILDTWHYNVLWILWACMSLIPLFLEATAAVSAFLYYRKLNR